MAFYGKGPDMGGGIPGAARNTMAKYPPNPSNNARAVGGGQGQPGAAAPAPPGAAAPAPPAPGGGQYDPEQFSAFQPGGARNPLPPTMGGPGMWFRPGMDTGFMRPSLGGGGFAGGGYQPATGGRGGMSFNPTPMLGAGPAPGLRQGKAGGPPPVGY